MLQKILLFASLIIFTIWIIKGLQLYYIEDNDNIYTKYCCKCFLQNVMLVLIYPIIEIFFQKIDPCIEFLISRKDDLKKGTENKEAKKND